jgi:predicted house-cleaning noncanonical NTP pyrophosphatase (MazG superfamily)
MGTVRYDKLVRDKIPDVIRKAGKEPVTDVFPREAILPALGRKLQEEVQEYLEGNNIEEMADILEVLHALAFHMGISWDEVESARVQKRVERGGFEDGIRLLEVRNEGVGN